MLRGITGRWFWLPAVVLALGLASLLLLVGVNRIHDRLIRRDQVRVSDIAKIESAVCTAHLWLEEYLTGDAVDLREIAYNLDLALDLSGTLLERRRFGELELDSQPLEDEVLRDHALRMRENIEEFRSISDRRQRGFVNGEAVGIGSAMDVEYDAVFRDVIEDARAIGQALSDRQLRNHARARLWFRLIFAAWSFVVAFAVLGLWLLERRRLKAELGLQASQAQLLQAQKMEAVGRLAGGIAHDINNYLGAIQSQSELVKLKSEANGYVGRKMDSIVRVVSKASSLIERLLAFSRQEPAKPTVVNLNRVVEEGVGVMVRRLVGEDIRIETSLDPHVGNVRIDPSQVEQVIVNLIVNAREAMPSGGTITIGTSNRTLDSIFAGTLGLDKAGEYVVLIVADTGTGIDSQIRDKIFDPFFSTKERSRGSGLGLSTVLGIVEQNGGAIDFDSRKDHGTTFRIFLPRTAEGAAAPPDDAPTEVRPGATTERILLVEDNDDLRESTSSMIETLGYRVSTAADAEEALELFERHGDEIDLVITDVVMPGLNGKQLVNHLRSRREGIKVLYISGYTDDAFRGRGISDEDAFLKKPFSAADLVGRIRELLDVTNRS